MTDDQGPAPTPGTKAQLEQENARLRREVDRLSRGGAAGRAPVAEPYLTEGDRQELLLHGVTNNASGGGRVTLTTAREQFPDADLADASDEAEAAAVAHDEEVADRGAGIRGFDYVYPSVRPGVIDPAVAGTPGINGPAADEV